jgi:formate dehydrogenase assembly factor FdhD
LSADVNAALASIEDVYGNRDLLKIVRAVHRCAWIADRVVRVLRDIGRGVA